MTTIVGSVLQPAFIKGIVTPQQTLVVGGSGLAGGSSPQFLDNIVDVDATNPRNGSILSYDQPSGRFQMKLFDEISNTTVDGGFF
jgi:hypothetical protein